MIFTLHVSIIVKIRFEFSFTNTTKGDSLFVLLHNFMTFTIYVSIKGFGPITGNLTNFANTEFSLAFRSLSGNVCNFFFQIDFNTWCFRGTLRSLSWFAEVYSSRGIPVWNSADFSTVMTGPSVTSSTIWWSWQFNALSPARNRSIKNKNNFIINILFYW